MKQKLKHLYKVVPLVLMVAPRLCGADTVGIKWSLEDYLKADTFEGLLLDILNILIVLAIPIIVLFIVYAGFLYVTARGNAEQVKQATQSLTYAIIGALMIIGAVAIAEVLKGVITALTAK
jgi:hypothetical protein